jgi:DNA-directed RNA polymerase sigma subunit (sigma70/sigma32)
MVTLQNQIINTNGRPSMVALITHETTRPRENQTPTCTRRWRRGRPAPKLRHARPPLPAEPRAELVFAKAKEEPKSEELAGKKEILRTEAKARSAAAAEVTTQEPVGDPRHQGHFSHAGDTMFRLYLREVGQVKLLTPQEEITLAARIKRGDQKARDQMIKANLRLVVKIAREYEGIGLPLLDLISEGNIGLIKAVERFDPAKGGKLSTSIAWWIKQSIKRALASQSKMNRLPTDVVHSNP